MPVPRKDILKEYVFASTASGGKITSVYATEDWKQRKDIKSHATGQGRAVTFRKTGGKLLLLWIIMPVMIYIIFSSRYIQRKPAGHSCVTKYRPAI